MPATGSRARRWAALVLASACLVLTGCTGAAPPAATPATSLPSGVQVEISQGRFDHADRVLVIRVINHSDTALDVVSASFRSARFAEPASYDSGVMIDAGRTVALRADVPPVLCAGDGDTPDTVNLRWRDDAGIASTTVKPTDETRVIDRILSEDCVVEAVDEVVSISPPPLLRIEGLGPDSVAWLDLTLTPTGEPGSVSVDAVSGTVLLTSVSGLDWPVGVTLDASGAPLTIPLDLRPTRCDPHAVAEDKRGIIFPLEVSTSAGFSGLYDFAVDDALRAQIYGWIAAYCGTSNAP